MTTLKSSYEQQMKKGVLEIVLLKLVCEKPTYGYELSSRITELSGGSVQLRDGTLYPILYRLEDDGLVTTQWAAITGREKPKKMYTITPRGKETLESLTQLWKDFSGFVNTVLKEEAQ